MTMPAMMDSNPRHEHRAQQIPAFTESEVLSIAKHRKKRIRISDDFTWKAFMPSQGAKVVLNLHEQTLWVVSFKAVVERR